MSWRAGAKAFLILKRLYLPNIPGLVTKTSTTAPAGSAR